MKTTIAILLNAAIWVCCDSSVAQEKKPNSDPQSVQSQTVNGSQPQKVQNDARSRAFDKNQRWSDGMNTKHSPDPRKKDEYGAPMVTPPKGQGTDNAGGIPPQRLHDRPSQDTGNGH